MGFSMKFVEFGTFRGRIGVEFWTYLVFFLNY